MLPASDEDIYISMKYCSQGEVKNPEIYRSSYITGPSKPKLKSKHKFNIHCFLLCFQMQLNPRT